ncbi:MAG TPA: glycosyltransferase family A protein [Terriglobia bacterium]|nr:glycosyltransferase family A protein [Terriglobia bacterium]
MGRSLAKVSVIIPAYNTAQYIAETLDSVFAQTFKDYEVIVINDGSPDTPELEKVLQPYRDRILYLKQENRGLAGARNTGIRHAQGKYVAFLDSDDCWFPEFLKSQLELLEGAGVPDLVYADSLEVGVAPGLPHRFMEANPSRGVPTFERLLVGKCVVVVSCVVARKQALIDAGLFDERLRSVEDYDLWLRVAHRGGRITYKEKVLAKRRVRPDSLSAVAVRMKEYHLQVLEKLDETLALSKETRSLLHRHIALVQANLELARGKDCLAAGRHAEAREHLSAANAYFRSLKLRLAVGLLCYAPNFAPAVVRAWYSILHAYRVALEQLRGRRQDLPLPPSAVTDPTNAAGDRPLPKGSQ